MGSLPPPLTWGLAGSFGGHHISEGRDTTVRSPEWGMGNARSVASVAEPKGWFVS